MPKSLAVLKLTERILRASGLLLAVSSLLILVFGRTSIVPRWFFTGEFFVVVVLTMLSSGISSFVRLKAAASQQSLKDFTIASSSYGKVAQLLGIVFSLFGMALTLIVIFSSTASTEPGTPNFDLNASSFYSINVFAALMWLLGLVSVAFVVPKAFVAGSMQLLAGITIVVLSRDYIIDGCALALVLAGILAWLSLRQTSGKASV